MGELVQKLHDVIDKLEEEDKIDSYLFGEIDGLLLAIQIIIETIK